MIVQFQNQKIVNFSSWSYDVKFTCDSILKTFSVPWCQFLSWFEPIGYKSSCISYLWRFSNLYKCLSKVSDLRKSWKDCLYLLFRWSSTIWLDTWISDRAGIHAPLGPRTARCELVRYSSVFIGPGAVRSEFFKNCWVLVRCEILKIARCGTNRLQCVDSC